MNVEKDFRKTPLVSVILTIYNTESYLTRCLDSIVNQTLKDIEIICIDDGSTDGSIQILKEYQNRDDRIQIIEQENKGAGAARNAGLAVAQGEYLSILDSDDFFDPEMLEKAYHAAREQDADIVVFQADFFNHIQQSFEPCTYSIRLDRIPEQNPFSAKDIPDRIFNIGCGWAWDKLFRRSFVEQSGILFQEIRTTNDMLFVFYLYTKAKSIYILKEVLVHQRIQAYKSLSVTRERSWNNFYLALSALKERLQSDNTYETFRHSFVNWALNFSLWHIDTLKTRQKKLLTSKCRLQYFQALDVLGNNEDYYIEKGEYKRLNELMHQGENVKVSVIIPIYNGERYLRNCLDSICGQSLKDIQIICVDDGSTDATAEILSEYESKDDRIMVISKEHTNAGDSRNTGLAYAEGKYLSFLDADDFFDSFMLQETFETAERDNAEICAFRCDHYDESNGDFFDCPWTLKLEEMPENRPFSNFECADKIFTMSSCTAWDKLYSRQFIEDHAIRFQSVDSCNDMLFTFSAFSAANRITTLDAVLAHQRINHRKSLAKGIEYLWHNFYDALYALKSFLVKHDCYANFKKSFVNWSIDFMLWNYHNYKGFYSDLIKQCLINRFFEELDISTFSPDLFYNNGFYEEMNRLMQEKRVRDANTIPKISVVIPVHNAMPYLTMCLESVVNQTLKDIEIICIENDSTDGSLETLQRYAKMDDRIRIIQNTSPQNTGVSRNIGLDAATGEYVHFLDADNYLLIDTYERIYKDAVYHHADWIKGKAFYYNDALLNTVPNAEAELAEISHDMYARKLYFEENYSTLLKCPAIPGNGIYKRSFLIEKNCRFNQFSCLYDRSFFINTLLNAENIILYNGFLLFNRANTKNSLQSFSAEHFNCCLDSAREIMDLCTGLPKSMFNFIIAREIHEILNWFKKYRDAYYYHIFQKTQDFFRELNDADFGGGIEAQSWYPAARDIIELPMDVYAEKYGIIYQNYSDPINIHHKVSVVLTVYNDAPWLPQSIESLLAQELQEIEIICVDNASEDNSLEILKEYSEKDHRIKVMPMPVHKCVATARNLGLQYSTGIFVAFLDTCDFFEKDMLSSLFEEASEKTLDMVICRADDVTKHEISLANAYKTEILPSKEIFSYKDMPDHILNFVMDWTGDKLIRRSMIIRNHLHFQELDSNENIVFINMALVCAERITFTDKPLVHHRTNLIPAGQDKDTLLKSPFDFYDAALELKKQLQDKGVYEEVERSFINYFLAKAIPHLEQLRDTSVYYEVLLELKSHIFEEMKLSTKLKNYFFSFNRKFYERMQDIMAMSYKDICRRSIKQYKREMHEMAEKLSASAE